MKRLFDKMITAILTLIGVIILLVIGPILFLFQIAELIFSKPKE